MEHLALEASPSLVTARHSSTSCWITLLLIVVLAIIRSMRWRLLVWTAVAIAVAAIIGLGIDVALEGISGAAELAGVIVAFCEVNVLLLAIVAFARERRAPVGQPEPGVQPEASTAKGGLSTGKYRVDVRDSTGVIIGDGNKQNINVRRSLPAADGDRSPG